jgi:hypothetical protein
MSDYDSESSAFLRNLITIVGIRIWRQGLCALLRHTHLERCPKAMSCGLMSKVIFVSLGVVVAKHICSRSTKTSSLRYEFRGPGSCILRCTLLQPIIASKAGQTELKAILMKADHKAHNLHCHAKGTTHLMLVALCDPCLIIRKPLPSVTRKDELSRFREGV